MSRREEHYIIDLLEQTRDTTLENNAILKHLNKIVNSYLVSHSRENEDDFGRNVLANLISNVLDSNKFSRRGRGTI